MENDNEGMAMTPRELVKVNWRPVPGWEDYYEVSDHGEVRSVDRVVRKWNGQTCLYKSKQITANANRRGYLHVNMGANGKKWHAPVHRLVALAFIDNPDNLPEVNHKNGNKSDNMVDNLEWCSSSYNTQHAYDNGLITNVGEGHNMTTLTDEQVKEIIRLRNECGVKVAVLGKMYGVHHSTISNIANGKTWKHSAARAACQAHYENAIYELLEVR